MPLSNSGNHYIVAFSDYLSRWPEAFTVPDSKAAISKLLVDKIISQHSAPRTLLSTRGKNFLSDIVAETCRIYQIRKVNCSAYHPQTDGVVERFNSTLCDSLSNYVDSNQKNWDDFLPTTLAAFRFSPSETTGESPFYMMYGFPIDCALLPTVDVSTSVLEHREKIVRNIERVHQIAKQNTYKPQHRMKQYYDRNTADSTFVQADSVWVYTPKTKKGLTKKLMHNWYGPYRVVERLGPAHYRLRTNGNKAVNTTVHANRMKFYIDPNERPLHSPLGNTKGKQPLNPRELPEGTLPIATPQGGNDPRVEPKGP